MRQTNVHANPNIFLGRSLPLHKHARQITPKLRESLCQIMHHILAPQQAQQTSKFPSQMRVRQQTLHWNPPIPADSCAAFSSSTWFTLAKKDGPLLDAFPLLLAAKAACKDTCQGCRDAMLWQKMAKNTATHQLPIPHCAQRLRFCFVTFFPVVHQPLRQVPHSSRRVVRVEEEEPESFDRISPCLWLTPRPFRGSKT